MKHFTSPAGNFGRPSGLEVPADTLRAGKDSGVGLHGGSNIVGFRINQNIGATVALNNLQKTDLRIGKSIERLSTGLRIVRAADDPSGLVISERFRAQVEGLGQAVSNSKDGINMVQTAEGALDEVSNILRNMRNLAVHAANTGPNDSETLKADQNQIDAALKTLDRIASTTQFGSKRILDGSAGVTGTVTNANTSFVSGTTTTTEGTYALNITSAAAKGKVTSNGGAGALVARGYEFFSGGKQGLGTLSGDETLTISGANVGDDINIAITTGDSLDDVINKINANTDVQAAGITAKKGGGLNLELRSDKLGSGLSSDLNATVTNNFNGRAVMGIQVNPDNYGVEQATGSSKLRDDELLTFSNGKSSINVALNAGMTMAAAASTINRALDNGGIAVTASFDTATAAFTLQNDDYGSGTAVTNTFSSNRAGAASTGLAGAAGVSYNIADSGTTLSGAAGSDGADVAGTIGGFAATGHGQFLSGDQGTDTDGLMVKIDGSNTGSLGTVTVKNNSLKFQIGAFAGQTARLSVDSLSTSSLGTTATGTITLSRVSLASVDVTSHSGEGAQDAIKVLDSAISQVSNLRSRLGSFQKDILESTVSTLGVAKQNLSASESNIRDVDFADEMMVFSKSQILSQTGMSMLTQANQSGQGVLSLFR